MADIYFQLYFNQHVIKEFVLGGFSALIVPGTTFVRLNVQELWCILSWHGWLDALVHFNSLRFRLQTCPNVFKSVRFHCPPNKVDDP